MTFSTSEQALHALEHALCHGKAPAAAAAFQDIVGLSEDLYAAGETVGNLLARLLDEFYVGPIAGFLAWLGKHPAEEIAGTASAKVEGGLKEIQQWRRTLRDVHHERITRDLLTQVRSRDLGAATQTALHILKDAAGNSEAGLRLARQVGAILGSLPHDRPRAEKVLEEVGNRLRSVGLEAAHRQAMFETFKTAQTNVSLAEIGQQEMQWNRMHTDAVVELMRRLPGPGSVGEPGPAEEERFYSAVHAVVAAYMCDAETLEFRDVARLLREFCPTDERATGPVEGVEDVAFRRMGGADRLTSVRAMRRLGEKEKLVELVLQLAKGSMDDKAEENLVWLMGGLGNPAFYPFLLRVLDEKRPPRVIDAAVDALGRVGDARSLKALAHLLSRYAKASVTDPPTMRRMTTVIAALGRISRHPKTPPAQRNEIVLQAFHALPNHRGLARVALQHLCAYNPAGLSPEAQKIAVGFIVDNLWTQDTRSKLAKGDPRQRTELGFREEVVDILINMGPGCLPALLEKAERHVLKYSGAYWAMADALAKIGSPQALPLLRKMVLNTLRTDESTIPEHLRETYYDAAKDQFVPLSRDRVAYALLYAVRRTCGAPGTAFLRDLVRQVQSGEYDSPGPETTTFLGGLAVGGTATTPDVRAASAEDWGGGDFGKTSGTEAVPDAGPTARPREKEPLTSLLKDIRGKGLFGVKMARRVSAIQETGARRDPEAIGALCEAFDSQERILKAAAETALQSIVAPHLPEPVLRRAVYRMLEELRGAPRSRVQGITQFLARLHPERDPLKSMLLRFVQTESDEKIKREIAEVFRRAKGSPAGQGIAQPAPDGEEAEENTLGVSPNGETPLKPGAPRDAPKLTPSEILELKREYFTARKAWIASGKRGPEPQPPKGIPLS